MLLTSIDEVGFEENGHVYSRNGLQYLSQSRFVELFEPEFDPSIIKHVARGRGVSVEVIQKEWDAKRDHSSDHGTNVHQIIEDSWNGKVVQEEYREMIESIRTLVAPYKIVFPEKRLYLDHYCIAGTADHPQERCKIGDRQVIDIFDYKTNLSKGITLYTSALKNDKWTHYKDQWFKEPISHLEHSLYVKDCLQLSLYMYMCMVNYNCIPGRMGILYINGTNQVRLMPVPFMRYEIEKMLEWYSQLKKL